MQFPNFRGADDMAGSSGSAENLAALIREFYDRHPYPPPLDDLDRYRRRWDDPLRRRADAHLFWPDEPYREDRSVLVAGCGTSQAAKYALRWPKAQVTGIDVSTTSIEKTEGLKRKYRLDNLEVHPLPVERAGKLGRCFDHVVCTGVLHHLPDPDAGLQALRAVLQPGGAMHLMVYATYGRAGVYLLQDYCRRLGIGATSSEIRELAASLQALPPDHPLVPLLRASPDFANEAGLADALLHPRDRAYTVPQFFDFIHAAGLQFGRWIRQAQYRPQCGAPATTPHRPLLDRLAPPEQYAAMELFRGTMLRHSAVVYRNDRPGSTRPIGFDGNAWQDYVPIRLPDTLCVQEKLPPGAIAVLINRNHTYTDIYLPLDRQQKKLFDGIDGKRSIAQLAGQLDAARALFEQLWCHDQVVFDASSGMGIQSKTGDGGA